MKVGDMFWPYALFVLADVDNETSQTISAILEESKIETAGVPYFWLATGQYTDAPKKDPKKTNHGTNPPVPDDFNPPLLGKKVADVVEWLNGKPADADMNSYMFAILDKKALEKTIVVCKTGEKSLKDGATVCLRQNADFGGAFFAGAPLDRWSDLKPAEIFYE